MHKVHSEYYITFPEKITFDEDGYPIPEGVSLLDPNICSIILCNYSKLKEHA